MTIASSMFIGFSALANPSMPTGLVPPPHASLPVIQNITKPFFIKKLVTVVNNITTLIYIKGIIWIGGVLFASLDKVW